MVQALTLLALSFQVFNQRRGEGTGGKVIGDMGLDFFEESEELEEEKIEMYEIEEESRRKRSQSIQEISPSMMPKQKKSIVATLLKGVIKFALVAIIVVATLGFIRALIYPRTRTEWQYTEARIREEEGALLVHTKIINTVPCLTREFPVGEQWSEYNDYKAKSLGKKKPNKGWDPIPDCGNVEKTIDCWILAPTQCDSHNTWEDIQEQRDEVIRGTEDAEVNRVYPMDPAGKLATEIKVAKGEYREYRCTTVMARSRYAGDEVWGQWEQISNCTLHVLPKGTAAIEPRIRRRERTPEGDQPVYSATLLTKWPVSPIREVRALLNHLRPAQIASTTSRVKRSAPSRREPPITDEAGGCPIKTTQTWFPWTIGVTKPGHSLNPYPPGLLWFKAHPLAGRKVLYYMEAPTLTTAQVSKLEGPWGSKVIDTLLTCIATALEPSDVPWQNLSLEELIKRRVRHGGELIPICRESKLMGAVPHNGTFNQDSNCQTWKTQFRSLLRRFRVSYESTPAMKHYSKLYETGPLNAWKNYAGLGLDQVEVEAIRHCWTKPGDTEEDKLRMFLHHQMAAQLTGFHLHVRRSVRYEQEHPLPGGFVVAIGSPNRFPPNESKADPNLYSNGTDKPTPLWKMDWKEEWPQLNNVLVDDVDWTHGRILIPPPLVLTKKTVSGYTLRWGLEPTHKAYGAQMGAYPDTTYGIKGKQHCTKDDQGQCTSHETHPEIHADMVNSAMVDIASTRTITHELGEDGQPVHWINWGTINRHEAAEIGCDPEVMIDRYFTDRNPPPQTHAWNNMLWLDSPVVRDKRDRLRWAAVSGNQGSQFYNWNAPQETGPPTVLLDCYRPSPGGLMRELQPEASYGHPPVKGKCGKLRSVSAQWLEKGFPYYWPPEAYLLGRWSFMNTQYCNNNGQGNCDCHGSCGQPGWIGDLLGPCSGVDFDLGTPWEPPSTYLKDGGLIGKEKVPEQSTGWTAREFTLDAVFPIDYAPDLNNGSCEPDRQPMRAPPKWSEVSQFGFVLAMLIGRASIDMAESVKEGAVEVYETVSSIIQTAWKFIAGILKWGLPCLLIAGLIILAYTLHRLGLTRAISELSKGVGAWAWRKGRTAPGEGRPEKGGL